MSAFADLLHDIIRRVHVFTEAEHQTMHDTVDKVEEEIKSWVQAPGVKTVEDTASHVPVDSTVPASVQDTPPVVSSE